MKIANSIVLIAFMLNSYSLYSQEITRSAEVTFITNEAFLIECNSKKILIDALYSSVNSSIAPPAEVIELLENATAPFDSVDLVFVTHNHQDHFSMNRVGKYLEHNVKAMLVCPDAVANDMQDYSGYNAIKQRIMPFTISSCMRLEKEANGIHFSILGLNHANNSMFPNMEHAGYLVNLEGVVLFHAADSWGEDVTELNAFQLQNENIDLAFFHVNYFYKGANNSPKNGLNKVLQYINPVNIVIMHNDPTYLHGGEDIVDSLKADFNNFFLFTTCLETKIFTKQITQVKFNNNIIPKESHLYQNYPNPFNPTTAISYQLAVASYVKLQVYDTLGREIKTLVDSFQTSGEYGFEWNGTDNTNNPVSSGIYFYCLLSNESSMQKKMLLIR